MTCLWNAHGPLMSGFGLLLPAPPLHLAAGPLSIIAILIAL